MYLDVAAPLAHIREAIGKAARSFGDRACLSLGFAGKPRAYARIPGNVLRVTALGTLSLVDLAIELRARFIYASTAAVYGDPLVHPQPESYCGNVDPVGPRAGHVEAQALRRSRVLRSRARPVASTPGSRGSSTATVRACRARTAG